MRPACIVSLLGLFAAGCSRPDVLVARQIPTALRGDVAAVAAANTRFACDVEHELPPGNTFFSPFSLTTALAMLDAGAAGTTDAQLRAALHSTLPGDHLHAAYGALITSLDTGRSYGAYTLAIADRLFGQEGAGFLPGFLDVTRDDYQAELAPVDFAGQPEAARAQINQWVATHTDGKIAELFPTGSIDDMTRLVLANAIVFAGEWDAPFDAAHTAPGSFHVAGAADVTVPMMHDEHHEVAVGGVPGGELVMLPFHGRDLAMVLLVPDDPDGLPALEASLNGAMLSQQLAATAAMLDNGELNTEVSLPKFQLTGTYDLVGILQALGVTAAFDASADFSNLDGRRDLVVQSAVHQATITVDEHGAEATAATGVGVEPVSLPAPITVDHSFAFLIYDQVTHTVLFMGRLVDPTQAD